MDIDGQIKSVQELLNTIERFKPEDGKHLHLRVWFRGHPKADWELKPGVYRDNFPVKDDEPARLKCENHLSQDFRVQSVPLHSGSYDDIQLYFLQQHYKMPTRLLDWTTNPLAALWFAVTDYENSDGDIYLMDAYKFKRDPDNKFEGIATGRHPDFQKAVRPILEWKSVDEFPNFIIPVRPDHFDRRITLQHSYFTFHVPEQHIITKSINDTLRRFSIPSRYKEVIKNELYALGIDSYSIFGDLESLAKRLRFAHNITDVQKVNPKAEIVSVI